MPRIRLVADNTGYKPADAPGLRESIRSLTGCKSVNVRITPSRIEVDMILDDPEKLRRLEDLLGPIREPEPESNIKTLVKNLRCWEAHELLEDLLDKGEWVRSILLAAAACAKAEEGRLEDSYRILARIRDQTHIDVDCLRQALYDLYKGRRPDISRCIGEEAWCRLEEH